MRVPAAALLGVLAVGCSGVDIQHGLDERQANQILVALDQTGIPADKLKEEGGREPTYKLRVSRADAAQAWRVLQALELPRERPKGMLEVFGEPSLIPTATQERALHLSALSGEVARTLEAIDGVLAARVHLSLPDDSPLRETEQRAEPAAAVLIKARPGAAVAADDVRRLVAGSVEGLKPARVDVVVTLAQAGPPVAAANLVPVGPFRVARQSRGALLGTLVGALALIIVLASLLVVVTMRAQRAVQRARARDELDRARDSLVSVAQRSGGTR